MAGDPLYDALGQEPPREPGRSRSLAAWAAGLVVAVLVVGSGIVLVRSGRDAGESESVAVARIEPAPKPVTPVAPPPPAAAAPVAPATPAGDAASPNVIVQPNGDTIEYQHGVKIIRLNPGAASNAIVVPTADPAAFRLQPADPRLVEPSRFGDLPRIGPNGLRPSEAYARPPSSLAAGAPRVALLVGGLGADPATTARAAKRLPPTVSFAFLPGGPDLPAQVATAREAGHEVLLQLGAMSDQPRDDAAPLDRLHRMMGRFTGYAGVAGELGGGILADAAVARPILRDIAARGLFFVDDAAAQRGDLGSLAGNLGLQSARAAVVVDAAAGADALKAALARLPDQARSGGGAIGAIELSGDKVEAVAALAAELTARGIVLVPVSALAGGIPVVSGAATAQ
jgi:polysaccharide deacetylase 2 family uncharacterized protein YibQ